MSKKGKGSPTRQIRIPENLLIQFNKFCEEKKTTLSEFLRYAGTLILTRPELWVDFHAGQEEKPLDEKLLMELKELILGQQQTIEVLKTDLGQLTKIEQIRAAEQAKGVLKEKILDHVSKKPLTIKELQAAIAEPELQKFIFPAPGMAFSTLDDVVTGLLEEKLIEYNKKTKRYSSLFPDSL